MNLDIFEVENKYVDYLSSYAPHMFLNKKPGQHNERKYIGILLEVNGLKYFAPLSSFKPKHRKIQESVDFVKFGDMAVLNINNMFPVPEGSYKRYVIANVKDKQYKKLLMNEYRILRVRQEKIRSNAVTVYNHRIKNGDSTKLGKRCNDFKLLEEKSKEYRTK
jgi:protein AbiQ